MKKLSVEPREVWFVGDGIHDLEAARAAGCVPVLVRNVNHDKEKCFVAHQLGLEEKSIHEKAFDNLSDIQKALEETFT